MPWKSDKQRRWGNSPAGHKALGDKGVAEWNAASKGKKLPERKRSRLFRTLGKGKKVRRVDQQ